MSGSCVTHDRMARLARLFALALTACAACSVVSGLDDFKLSDGAGAQGGGGAGEGGQPGGGSPVGGGGSGAGPCTNRVLVFDGDDDIVRMPAGSAYAFGAFTIELWFRLDAPVGAAESRLLSYENHDAAGFSLAFATFTNPPGALHFRVYDEGISQGFSPGPPPPGMWRHVAGVYDGAEARLYLDGVEVDQSTGSYSAFVGDLVVGSSSAASSWFFRGAIDEVRLSRNARYTESFTPEERFVVDMDTAGLWHFDEGDGNTAVDAAGAIDGVLEGSSGPSNGPQYAVDRCD
jgi:Concanavalin A-like lectin/glucanases superfamily